MQTASVHAFPGQNLLAEQQEKTDSGCMILCDVRIHVVFTWHHSRGFDRQFFSAIPHFCITISAN